MHLPYEMRAKAYQRLRVANPTNHLLASVVEIARMRTIPGRGLPIYPLKRTQTNTLTSTAGGRRSEEA